jgi:hypothetical protein
MNQKFPILAEANNSHIPATNRLAWEVSPGIDQLEILTEAELIAR